jgi:hypothetical protein
MPGFLAAGIVSAFTAVRAALKAIESDVIAGIVGHQLEIEGGTADHADPPHNMVAFIWLGHGIISFQTQKG